MLMTLVLSYLDTAVVTPLLIGFVLFRVTYTRRRRAWLFAFTSGTSLRETLTRSYT